nr:hypothetical protein [Tanacetum cinerariifolium]
EHGDKEEQGNDNNAAEEPVTAVDDVVDQSIQSPTPFTPPPQQPPDIPSTSHVQSPPPQQQSSLPAQPQGADFPMSLLQEARIETSDDTIIEDMSNQGRVIDESDKDEVNDAAVMTTAALVKVVVPSTRRRRGVRYQVMKKIPQTEAQARRNMMVYLKNTAGFTLDYFKGISYDGIH